MKLGKICLVIEGGTYDLKKALRDGDRGMGLQWCRHCSGMQHSRAAARGAEGGGVGSKAVAAMAVNLGVAEKEHGKEEERVGERGGWLRQSSSGAGISTAAMAADR